LKLSIGGTLTDALMEGKRTAVFFNNHPDGSGAKNARRLGEMILEGR